MKFSKCSLQQTKLGSELVHGITINRRIPRGLHNGHKICPISPSIQKLKSKVSLPSSWLGSKMEQHCTVIRYESRHEYRMSCREVSKQTRITKYPIQFFLNCVFSLLTIVPSIFHPRVRKLNKLCMANTVAEIILVMIPIDITSRTVFSLHDGIEVSKHHPRNAIIQRTFLAKVSPQSCACCRGIMAINKCNS